MFNLKNELKYIISLIHNYLGFNDALNARQLMLGTCATETNLGQKLRQGGYSMQSDEGAFGFWQMELSTDADIWTHFIIKKASIYCKINKLAGGMSHKDALIGNIYYACAMARLQYARHKEPLPPADDLIAQGKYYKKYFNGSGKGSAEKYVADYKRFLL